MPATASAIDSLTTNVTQEIMVRSSLEATFNAILEELGPANVGMNNEPMKLVIEPWPGGRWFRDLGDNNGHYWATVQAIKRPTLLEFSGPLMFSLAVANNVQYRLKAVDGGTLITFRHSAFGQMPDDYRDGLKSGWGEMNERIRQRADASA